MVALPPAYRIMLSVILDNGVLSKTHYTILLYISYDAWVLSSRYVYTTYAVYANSCVQKYFIRIVIDPMHYLEGNEFLGFGMARTK